MFIKKLLQVIFTIFGLLSPIMVFILKINIWFIAIWLFCGILYFFTNTASKSPFLKTLWFLPVVFYLVHIIGVIYSQNLKSALFDLEVKLSLILFVFLFYLLFKEFNRSNIGIIQWSYIFTIFGISIYLLIRAILAYYNTNNASLLFYNELTKPYHPTYISMYIVMAIVFILQRLYSSRLKYQKILYFLWMVYFAMFLFMVSSKAGILTFSLILFIYSIFKIWWDKKYITSLIFILLSVAYGYYSTKTNYRFEIVSQSYKVAKHDVSTQESNSVRILVWSTALDIIKQNILFGVGTGDVKDQLINEYQKRNMIGALEKKLNAHNQYLETLMGLGLMGLFVLILLIFCH